MTYQTSYASQFYKQDMAAGNLRRQEELRSSGTWYAPIDPNLLISDLPIASYQSSVGFPQQQIHLQTQQQQERIQNFMEERRDQQYVQQDPNMQLFPNQMGGSLGPVGTYPGATFVRQSSPTSSQGLSSTCTSAQSPGAEPDWAYFNDNVADFNYDFYTNAPPTRTHSTSYGAVPTTYQHYALPAASQASGESCVNMSQVQSFADPQEVMFETDEGYEELAMFVPDEKHTSKLAPQNEYHYQADSTMGNSIKDVNSPAEVYTPASEPANAEVDAEADADAEAEIDPETEAATIEEDESTHSSSDGEYRPRGTRTRKRISPPKSHSPRSTTKRTSNQNRITKTHSNTTSSKLTCKSCHCTPFATTLALSRHIASAHTRAYTCVFAFAGCASTFANKNEWKRHVSSQHLSLSAWVCTLGSCGTARPGAIGGAGMGAEFNRKDLFTQHLRRMHAPHHVKRKKEIDEGWESEIRRLQVECLMVKREAPVMLACCVQGCGKVWEGKGAWDDRMEHVGKHLEKDGGKDGVEQGQDEYLVQWAEREGIIESVRGEWRLCVGKGVGVKREVEDDEDAVGEVE